MAQSSSTLKGTNPRTRFSRLDVSAKPKLGVQSALADLSF